MRINILLLCLHWTLIHADDSEEQLKKLDFRAKRQINALPLVYPYGGTYKLITGYTSPIKNDDEVGLIFLFNFQYQYLQFTNITQLSQYYVINQISREQRDADLESRKNERLVFYKAVTDLLDVKGINGQECLLRAICEAAQFPVEEEGFVGEIIHVLLTPDYGQSPFEDQDEDLKESFSPYTDAAVAGRQMFDCPSIYAGCPEGKGVLEFITQLRNE